MRIPIHRLILGLALTALLLAAGCEKKATELSQDQSAIESIIAEELDFFTADLFGDTDSDQPDDPLARTVADITPWRFFRQVLDVDRDITISVDEMADPMRADVTWTAVFDGVFHVIDTEAHTWDKDFTDTAVRYATFERLGAATTTHRGWRLTEISGTELVSSPVNVQIQEVHVTSSGGLDVIFDNVSDLIARQDVLAVTAGDTIMVTVTTGDTTDVIMMHYPAFLQGQSNASQHHVRRRFRNNGDGTYSCGFVAHRYAWVRGQWREQLGPRHFTIDVLSHGTIFTDDEPYDAMSWAIIYRVVPPPMASRNRSRYAQGCPGAPVQ
jgi:hypothetical protein